VWSFGRRRFRYRDLPARCHQDPPASPRLVPSQEVHWADARSLQGLDRDRPGHLEAGWCSRPVQRVGADATGLHSDMGRLHEHVRVDKGVSKLAHGSVVFPCDDCRHVTDKTFPHAENKWLARTLASITAGGCSTLVTNPIWVIKTRLMSQVSARASEDHRPPWHYKNTFDAFRTMYAKEGIASFYSGLSPALLGLTHVAIQFPLYEFLKMKFTGLEMGQTDANIENVHWLGIAGATVLSKVAATSATYPHEVLRTRLQTQQRSLPSQSHDHVSFQGGQHGLGYQTRPPGTSSSDGMINMPRYRGVIRTCTVILHEEGWRAFYNGMGTNMVRAVPAAVTTMMTFESLKIVHQKLKNEGRRIQDEE
jgi:hypothetical protein